MNLTIPQPELAALVAAAVRGVSMRSYQEVQQCILLDATDGHLRAAATDLEYIGVDAAAQAIVERPGQVAVNGRQFAALVARLPEGIVTLEGLDNYAVRVTCGGVNVVLRGLSASDWQGLPALEEAASLTLPAATLQRLLDQTLFAVGRDETRPILTGVLLEIAEGSVKAVATDTYRLALTQADGDWAVAEPRKVLVAGLFCGEVRKLLGDVEGDVTVRYSQRLVSVAWEGMTLTSRLIEGEFPNYEKIIPERQDKDLEVGADALDDALARMLLLGSLDSNRVVFRLGDEVTVSAYNAGDTIEEVLGEARYSGEPLEIGVNGKFLREGLAAAGGETVRVQFGNALQPMLVASPAVPAWRYVVMPMQIIG